MAEKTAMSRKRRGPPATGKGFPVVVRMQPMLLSGLDGRISKQEPRPAAIRRLVELGLKGKK